MGVWGVFKFCQFIVYGLYWTLTDTIDYLTHPREGYIPGSSSYNVGKWAIVTGGNAGIGLETVKGLGKRLRTW